MGDWFYPHALDGYVSVSMFTAYSITEGGEWISLATDMQITDNDLPSMASTLSHNIVLDVFQSLAMMTRSLGQFREVPLNLRGLSHMKSLGDASMGIIYATHTCQLAQVRSGGRAKLRHLNIIEISTYLPPSVYFPFFSELFTDLVGNKWSLDMIITSFPCHCHISYIGTG